MKDVPSPEGPLITGKMLLQDLAAKLQLVGLPDIRHYERMTLDEGIKNPENDPVASILLEIEVMMEDAVHSPYIKKETEKQKDEPNEAALEVAKMFSAPQDISESAPLPVARARAIRARIQALTQE